MDAALALDRRMLEEQVHQHRLAASDRTMDVQSLRRILASTGEAEPCLPSADAAGRLVVLQRIVQALQLLGSQLLHGIGLQLAGAAQRTIGGERSVGHRENGMVRSEEHTSELQSLMRISYAVFCLK